MASKIITSVHSSLPKNKKSEEFNEFFRKMIYTTFTEEEFTKFCEDMKALVQFANGKYPRTTPYQVTAVSDCVSVRLDAQTKQHTPTFAR